MAFGAGGKVVRSSQWKSGLLMHEPHEVEITPGKGSMAPFAVMAELPLMNFGMALVAGMFRYLELETRMAIPASGGCVASRQRKSRLTVIETYCFRIDVPRRWDMALVASWRQGPMRRHLDLLSLHPAHGDESER
jgi:hypothetical protein